MRCHKNGVGVLDWTDDRPYKIWEADSYRCPTCGFMAVVGFAQRAIGEWEEGIFTAALNRHKQRGTLINNFPEQTIRKREEERISALVAARGDQI